VTVVPDTTLTLEAYIEGTVPDVCVVSGQPTAARVRHVTEVLPAGRLERVMHRVEQRLVTRRHHGRVTVVRGLVPVHPDVSRSLAVRRRMATAGVWVGLIALVAVAWSATSWAPVAAAALLAATGASVWLRIATARRMPAVTVDEDRAIVRLRRVHPDFVAALDRTR
jgi:hypothetical protein